MSLYYIAIGKADGVNPKVGDRVIANVVIDFAPSVNTELDFERYGRPSIECLLEKLRAHVIDSKGGDALERVVVRDNRGNGYTAGPINSPDFHRVDCQTVEPKPNGKAQ